MSESLFVKPNFDRWIGNYTSIESAPRSQASGVKGKVKRPAVFYMSFDVAKRATFGVAYRIWSPEDLTPTKCLTAGSFFTAHITHNDYGTPKYTIEGIEKGTLVSKSKVMRIAKKSCKAGKMSRSDRKEVLSLLKDYLNFKGDFDPSKN